MRYPVKRTPLRQLGLLILLGFVISLSACGGPLEEVAVPVAPEPLSEAGAASIATPARAARATPRAGVVTAGDIDDGLNFAAFRRYQSRAAQQLRLRKARLDGPIRAQMLNSNGQPAPGVRFTLRRSGASEPFFSGFSSVDGMINVFPRALSQAGTGPIELRSFTDDGADNRTVLTPGAARTRVKIDGYEGWTPDFLDLVFVMDTTGSMGDEIDWIARDVASIVRQAKAVAPGVDVRFGFVGYKSPGDIYNVRSRGFTKSAAKFRRWLRRENPSGGGNGESVADALATAVAMNWRRGRGERLIIQIGDEPPRLTQTDVYYRAAARAAKKGIQIYSVEASGKEPALEFLMRQGAAMTGGRYVFLTDDSGVGLAHKEPSLSCYVVTELNGLMVRLLKSELSGLRVEPRKGEIIRRVGSYKRGRCRD